MKKLTFIVAMFFAAASYSQSCTFGDLLDIAMPGTKASKETLMRKNGFSYYNSFIVTSELDNVSQGMLYNYMADEATCIIEDVPVHNFLGFSISDNPTLSGSTYSTTCKWEYEPILESAKAFGFASTEYKPDGQSERWYYESDQMKDILMTVLIIHYTVAGSALTNYTVALEVKRS